MTPRHFSTARSLVDALKAIGLGDEVGIVYPHISETQFSVARHYGGAKVNGKHYEYLPQFDWLIRADAHRKAIQWAKAQRAARPEPVAEQAGLF